MTLELRLKGSMRVRKSGKKMGKGILSTGAAWAKKA